MSTTLIIRDATLAINGSPEARGGPAEHLPSRIREVASFDEDFLGDCLDVLVPSVENNESDLEVLEAVVVIGLARPELARSRGLSPIAAGRRLAGLREKSGQGECALALLELLVKHHSGHKALERDLAGLMRRQGMVGELVERYLERSRGLLQDGRTSEAIAWLREVLLLDRSRKDVARTIRDLRFQEIDKAKGRRSVRRVAAITLVGSVLVFTGLLREKRLAEEYRAVPSAKGGDLVGMKERLARLESFVDRHPIWHGSLGAIEARTEARLAVDRAEETQRKQEERKKAERLRTLEDADLARKRGVMLAESGDYSAALEELRRSLRLADTEWKERERVQRDVDAISSYLEEQR